MYLLILVTSIYLVNCQYERRVKPEKCYGDDKVMERRCCIFPPFFLRTVARSCGARFALIDINNEYNVTNLRRENSDYDCQYWKCLLNKYGLLNTEEKLITENYFGHLDKWTSLNQDFSVVMAKAKIFCRDTFRYYFPLTACEFYEFQKCIRGFVNVNCPLYIQSKECLEWKEFYEECKEFYL